MSAYDELHYRCLSSIEKHDAGLLSKYGAVSQILAEVFRTLETVTPEMESALDMAIGSGAVRDWITALNLSPLAPVDTRNIT